MALQLAVALQGKIVMLIIIIEIVIIILISINDDSDSDIPHLTPELCL